jgi:hypothetical protein
MTPISDERMDSVSKEWGLFFVKPKAALWAGYEGQNRGTGMNVGRV